MATIRIFVVFHLALDERLIFPDFSAAEVHRWFIKYGVNAAYPQKRVTGLDGVDVPCRSGEFGVVLEYDLSDYSAELQARGFMETSCFVHVESNGLDKGADYVGVCQYDMRWTPDAAKILRNLAEQIMPGSYVFGIAVGPIVDRQGAMHPLTFPHLRNWPFLLQSYNRFFGTSWSADSLIDKPLTLWQTYVMPRIEFSALSRWLRALCAEVYPWAARPPYEAHWGSLGGYTERAESLFIALRLHERRFEFQPLPVQHDSQIVRSLGIQKTHYNSARNIT